MRGWGVGVDVSNVCRDPNLGGPEHASLDRLDLVVEAWRQVATGEVHLVADHSLRRQLAALDQRRFDTMVRAGALVAAPVADELLLRWAHDHGAHVLSRDQFLDHRRDHPWIDQHPERFHQWSAGSGEVRISAGPVEPAASALVSVAIERKELRRSGLDPKRHWNLLHTRWRCTNGACAHARLWPDHLLVWPERDRRGGAVCPGCGQPLDRVGRRGRLVQMVVGSARTGQELLRFPLESGQRQAIGRGMGAGAGVIDITVGLGHDEAARVSRRHASLLLRKAKGEARIIVTDEGSRCGTVLHQGDRTTHLVEGDEHVLVVRDRLVLAGEVTLRLSGVRFASDDRLPATGRADPHETLGE